MPFVHYSHYEQTQMKAYVQRWGDPDGVSGPRICSLRWWNNTTARMHSAVTALRAAACSAMVTPPAACAPTLSSISFRCLSRAIDSCFDSATNGF